MHILCAARLVPWKGILKLIDLFVQVRTYIPALRLSIAGDGPERATIEAYIRQLGVSESVTMHGQLSAEELAMQMHTARAFVLPTAYEGFSHVLLEAINAGVPIVTTPVGGNRELVTHDVTGMLVSLNDDAMWVVAINRILTDVSYAQTLADQARTSAQSHFAESVVAPKLVDAVVL
jgi:glycogen(starch) synthase